MKLRKKLVRRLLLLVVCAGVAGITVGGYAAWRLRQIQLSYAADREVGLAAARSGDHQVAIDRLGRYLHRYPHDVELLSLYARSRSKVELPNNGHIREAVLALRHLLQIDPKRNADRALLLDLYVRAGYATETLDVANTLLPPDPKAYRPTDTTALSARTKALGWLGRYDEAAQTARRWSSVAPADLDAQLALLALLYQSQHRGTELTQIGEQLAGTTARAVPPGDPRPDLVRAYAQFLSGAREAAGETLRRAAGHVGSDPHLIRALAEQFDSIGLAEDALAALTRLPPASLQPSDRADLARRSWELGRGTQVVDALASLDDADTTTDPELLGIKALSLLQVGRAGEVAAVRKALAARTTDPLASAWLAVIDFVSAPFEAAQPRPLLDACKAALRVRPDESYLRYFYGDACSALGERDLALEAWRKAAELDPRWAAPVVQLAYALSQAGLDESAVQAAREAFRRAPHLPAVAVVSAEVWGAGLEHGRLEHSDSLLTFANEIQDQLKAEPVMLCIRVALLAQSGHADQARDLIREALGDKALPAQSMLLRLATISDAYRLGLGEQILARSEREYGMTPQLAHHRAMSLAAAGRAADGARIFDARHSATVEPRWQTLRAQYLDAVADPHALAAVSAAADSYPTEMAAQELALSARCAAGDRALRQRSIQRLREITGQDGLRWRVEQARWLLDFGGAADRPVEAARLLREVVERAPALLDARLLLARAAEMLGQTSEAIDQLTRAQELDPGSAQLPLRLAQLLEVQGEFDRARQQLENAVGRKDASPETLVQAARMFAAGGDAARGIGLLEQSAARAPLSVQDRLLLAELYRQRGDLAKAEASCRPLLEKPEPAAVEFTAELLASQGRIAEAREVLRRLDGPGVAPVARYLVLAAFAARFERADQALELYHKAVDAAPSDPRVWRAYISAITAGGRAADIQSAVDQAVRAAPGDAALQSLRQNAPLLTRVLPDGSLRQIAVSYVANPSDAAPLELLRLLAPEKGPRLAGDQLVQPLRELTDRFPYFLPARLLLCQVQAGLGRTDDALETATRAAQRFPTSVEPLQLEFALLSAAGRWEEATAAASAWRDRSAEHPEAADVALATAELHAGRASEAEKRLEKYVQSPAGSGQPVGNADVVLSVYAAARLANGHGPVEPVLEGLLSQGAQGRRTWILFALDHLPAADSATWLRKAAAVTPTSSTGEQIFIARAWDTLATRANDRQYAAESRSVLAALVARPNAPVEALVAMGMRCEEDGDWKKAEGFYRQALRASPRLAVAQNNLAMLLARDGRNLDEARELSAAAVKEVPNAAAFYDTLGYVQGKSGKYTDAVRTMETAVHMDASSVSYRVHLAQLLSDGRQTDKAAAVLRAIDALHLDPNRLSEPVRRQLDALRRALGQPARQQVSSR